MSNRMRSHTTPCWRELLQRVASKTSIRAVSPSVYPRAFNLRTSSSSSMSLVSRQAITSATAHDPRTCSTKAKTRPVDPRRRLRAKAGAIAGTTEAALRDGCPHSITQPIASATCGGRVVGTSLGIPCTRLFRWHFPAWMRQFSGFCESVHPTQTVTHVCWVA